MNARALPERYRRASNIHEGYEVRTTEGEWLRVSRTLRIYAPANIVRLDLDGLPDEAAIVTHPQDEIMSRRPAGVA